MSERKGYEVAIAVLRGVYERTGSPAATWAADYLFSDPDKLAPPAGPVDTEERHPLVKFAAEIERLRAERDRYRAHSITLNTISWRIASALGDVPEGADQVEGNPVERADRLIADRDEARAEARLARALLDKTLSEFAQTRAELERAHSALRGADPWRPVLPDAETLARTRYEWCDLTEAERASAVENAAEMLELLQRAMDHGESSGEVRETASPASVTDEMVRAYVRAHNEIYGTDGGEGWPRPIDAVRAGLAAVLSLLADQGRVPNRCKACGTFRLDGAPPVLHKCLTCGFEGSAELHQRCPGCAGEQPEVPPC